LFFEWPEVEEFHNDAAEGEVLLGDAILVVPVVKENATSIHVEKPPGIWYQWRTGKEFKESGNVPVTLDDIPLFLRGGRIVPIYPNPVNCGLDTIVTDMTLVIGVDENWKAEGWLYLDDGLTFNYTEGEFIHRRIEWNNGTLRWSKAEAQEKRIPSLLKKAKVTTVKIYDIYGVKTYTGLSFLVSEEWEWHSPSHAKHALKKWQIGVISAGAVVAVAIVIVVIVLVMRKRRENLDEQLVTVSSTKKV
jgi:alpha-glucosidase (family GH31 glycosyl hydrolase)